MVGREMTPQRFHVLISNLWICYLAWQKDFAVMMKLSILRWREYPELSRWAQANYMNPYKQRIFPGCDQREMWPWKKSQRVAEPLVLKMEEGGPWAKECGKLLDYGKSKEMDCPLELPERNTALWDPCCTSELQISKIITLGFWNH